MKKVVLRILTSLILLTALGLAGAQTPQVEVLEETGEYRIVEYAGETYRVPPNPERMVVLSYRAPDNLLALGLVPVGMEAEENGAFPPYLASHTGGCHTRRQLV